MMRILCTVAALMLATVAFAGSSDMTPQMAMEKVMNCPVCSAWTPDVSQNIRCDIFTTKNGYIESFMNSNESMAPAFETCAAECEKRIGSVASMTAEQKAKLCPFCQARVKLMGQKDVTLENFKTHMGWITVGSSTTPAGQKALAEYAAASKQQLDLMEAAMKEMANPETMKSKM